MGAVFFLRKYETVLYEKDVIPSSKYKTKKIVSTLIFLSPILVAVGLYSHNFVNPVMPLIIGGALIYLLKECLKCNKQERMNIARIFFLVVLLMLFFGVSEQVRSSLILFAGRHVEIEVWGWSIPLSSLTALNPIIIILMSPILGLYVTSHSYKSGLNNIKHGFILMFLVFSYLLVITHYSVQIKLAHLCIVMGGIAFAELLVGPVIYSLCSILSPKHLKASMMGMVTIGYAAANHLAGHLAHSMGVKEDTLVGVSMEIYRNGFKSILIILALSVLATLVGGLMNNKSTV